IPFLLILHSVIPFPRTWIYLIIPSLFLFGLFIEEIKFNKLLNYGSTVILSVSIVLILINYSNKKILLSNQFNLTAKEIAEYLIRKNAKTIYVKHPLLEINLLYIFEDKGEDILVKYHWVKIDDYMIEKIKSCCEFFITDNASITKSYF